MKVYDHPLCAQCHRFIEDADGECPAGHAPTAPAKIVALASFDGAFGSMVRALKYDGHRELGTHLGRLLSERLGDYELTLAVAVPTTPAKRRKRGYGHAEVIGQACASNLGCPWRAGAIEFTRKVADQTRLSAAQRKANLTGAFRLARNVDVSGADVLVIDDVYTTGATMGEAGRVLMEAGARSVTAAVVVVNLSMQRAWSK